VWQTIVPNGVGQRKKNPAWLIAQPSGVFACNNPGDTYFRTFGTIIGSKSLTTVFGMDTGVAFSI
jgi:hypothetical protein